MTQSKTSPTKPAPLTAANLSVFNRQPLTPEQQLQALKRVQSQAEQRVKLGMQLFKAAESRLSTQTDVLQQIKTLQSTLREQLNQDVAKTLQQYDQWIGQIDESFTTAIHKLEEKIDAVQQNLTTNEARMSKMLERAEAMLDQTRELLSHHTPPGSIPGNTTPASPAAPPKPNHAVAPLGGDAPVPKSPSTPTDTSTHTPNAATEIGKFTHPTNPANTESVPEAPQPSEPPNQPDASVIPGTLDDDHKIYSKLLQRLIEENPAAEAHGPAPTPAPGSSPGTTGTPGHTGKDTPTTNDAQDQADAA